MVWDCTVLTFWCLPYSKNTLWFKNWRNLLPAFNCQPGWRNMTGNSSRIKAYGYGQLRSASQDGRWEMAGSLEQPHWDRQIKGSSSTWLAISGVTSNLFRYGEGSKRLKVARRIFCYRPMST